MFYSNIYCVLQSIVYVDFRVNLNNCNIKFKIIILNIHKVSYLVDYKVLHVLK